MKPEPQEIKKDAGKDLKTFTQLPAKTKELLILEDQEGKATGQERVALNNTIREESKEGDPRLKKGQ
ncbi:MAG: hypothetical protein ABI273_08335 [Lacunisphaera sp.]